jgi:hypothetical protein
MKRYDSDRRIMQTVRSIFRRSGGTKRRLSLRGTPAKTSKTLK